MKRGDSGLSLIVGIDKPLGMTSHDVINRVRTIFGEKRVGHAGTLDPDASGVLLVCVGCATRLNSYLTCDDKSYQVGIRFGYSTDTDDAAGEILIQSTPQACLSDPEYAKRILASILGESLQRPPLYSALKVNGQKSYEAARKGQTLDLQPRPIEIYRAELQAIEPDNAASTVTWIVDLHVSKGTYIRAVARDLGEQLGCPAHVSSLRRTISGHLSLSDCVTLEELEKRTVDCALDPVALLNIPSFCPDESQVAALANGNPIRFASISDCDGRLADISYPKGLSDTPNLSVGDLVSVATDKSLLALYRVSEKQGLLKAHCVFPIGVSRG